MKRNAMFLALETLAMSEPTLKADTYAIIEAIADLETTVQQQIQIMIRLETAVERQIQIMQLALNQLKLQL